MVHAGVRGDERQALVVELARGDVLVLPPFWWHEVTTLADSISVNVWSHSPEYMAAMRAYAAPVPAHPHSRRSAHAAAAGGGLAAGASCRRHAMSARRCCPAHRARPGCRQHWAAGAARAVPAPRRRRPAAPGHAQGRRTGHATAPHTPQGADLQRVCGAKDWAGTCAALPDMQTGSTAIAAALQPIRDPALFALLFGNYIEHVAVTVVGADAVVPFLQFCF